MPIAPQRQSWSSHRPHKPLWPQNRRLERVRANINLSNLSTAKAGTSEHCGKGRGAQLLIILAYPRSSGQPAQQLVRNLCKLESYRPCLVWRRSLQTRAGRSVHVWADAGTLQSG